MLKKTIVIIGAMFALTACSSGNEASDQNVSMEEKIYQNNCSSCHGNSLEGGAGPALNEIGSKLDQSEIEGKIKNGGNGMPAGIIQGEDAENVAAWLSQKK